MEKETGRVKKFHRHKGYESIPRELLQSNELSLESIGLLCNLQSYPDDWTLFKTELYKRFPKNKRKPVERMWDELVEYGYIIQFRKRDGKRYTYEYYFSTSKFNDSEISEISKNMALAGYSFYLKESVKEKMKEKLITESEEDLAKTDIGNQIENAPIWDVQNEQSNENVDITGFSGMPNLDSPKGTDNIFTTNRFDDDEYNNKLNSKVKFDKNDDDLKVIGRLLLNSDVPSEEVIIVLNELDKDRSLIHADSIIAQLDWCIQKSQTDGIVVFSKYFLNGLKKRVAVNRLMSQNSFESDLLSKLNQEKPGNNIQVPLHNWLDN